jgi:hypothetical protein
MKILLIPLGFEKHTEDHRLFSDMCNAFENHGNVRMFQDIEDAIQFSPDIVFYQGGLSRDHCIMIKVSNPKCKWQTWTGDVRYAPMKYLCDAAEFTDQFYFPFSGDLLNRYRRLLQKNCIFIFEPIQNWRFREPKIMNEPKGISFVGNLYDHLPGGIHRRELSTFVKAQFTEVHLYGEGMEHGHIDHYEVPDLYNDSYAVICENNWHDIDSYFTPRNLTAMSAGSCALMRIFPGIEYHFENWKDCVYYRDKYELLDIISFLKDNPDVRNKIAATGYKTVKDNFNMSIFAKRFIEAL